jgi:single-strand DNA-binding protein
MAYFNQWNGVLRLGRDPEFNENVGSSGLGAVSAVISKKWKDKQSGEWKENASWVMLKAWGNAGKWLARDYCKGDEVLVSGGELDVEEWEKDGARQRAVSIVIGLQGKVSMFKKGKHHDSAPQGEPQDEDIELPF